LKLKTMPIKNQQDTELCWLFAMLTTIETENLQHGDSIVLAPDFLLYHDILNHASTQQKINQRDMMPQLMKLVERYGIIPQKDMPKTKAIDRNKLIEKANRIIERNNDNRQKTLFKIQQLLDANISFVPTTINLFGVVYTAKQFAESITTFGQFVYLSAYPTEKQNAEIVPSTPDNVNRHAFLNVSLDSLMRHIDVALHSGHPVCWEGDISEPTFSFETGVATMENVEKNALDSVRAVAMQRDETTDDHCMVLVGVGHDSKGTRYYLAQNSWECNNTLGGFIWLSEDYILQKTIAIALTEDAFSGK